MLKKVLIANRGEIAMRILFAAHELGIQTVGVYSDADTGLPHLARCDEVVRLGPPPAAESYLQQDRLIAIAKQTGCDCIHPGYGFLSENAGFAQKVTDAGLKFVGPNARAIDLLGDKIRSKAIMEKAGVPTVRWFEADLSDVNAVVAQATDIGYPVIIKPSGGGGGKGMHVVYSEAELRDQVVKARAEATAAFGETALLIEKYLEGPRHIEFQILCDEHGTALHLFERECSIQRRNQKLIEETPSPFMTPELRVRMGEAAVAAARASGYTSAGTCEFLVDKDHNFYFLEVNTRLQVEHPITERVVGVDIAKAMFRIASGEKLWFTQESLRQNGHAIECRIIAEDPFSNFMPSFGRLEEYVVPCGPRVRVDNGYVRGGEVTQYYDSLLAKLITWGENRGEAINRMKQALADYHIIGVDTCIPFHAKMMTDPDFVAGDFNIKTAEDKLKAGFMTKPDPMFAAALALALEHSGARPPTAGGNGSNGTSDASAPTKPASGWKMASRPTETAYVHQQWT